MRRIISLIAIGLGFVSIAAAQDEAVKLELRSFLYADNTEFLANPYRDGETLLGGQLRLNALFPVSSRARFLLGVETNSRAGDSKAFVRAWPVISLEVDGPGGTFVMGTLRSGQLGREPSQGLWPDTSGPHRLVPPLQLDTLTMTRPYEAGLQWIGSGRRVQHDVWIAWQHLNTPQRRERLDAGINAGFTAYERKGRRLSALMQAHLVHEGGQLFHTGAVGDSLAGGPGVGAEVPVAGGVFNTQLFALFSKHNPSRGNDNRVDRLDGHGGLLTIAYERKNWRGAYVQWFNATDFVKWEGDPNYGSLNNDGAIHHDRTYKEMSLSRRFVLTPEADLVGNVRLYRVDSSWDYSYRIGAALRLSHPLR